MTVASDEANDAENQNAKGIFMNKIAFVFPGQGSQTVGMLSEMAANFSMIQETFATASEVLDYDLWKLIQDGPADLLNKTESAQPALLTAGVSIYNLWKQCGGKQPSIFAGHSLGEYTALVCAGSINFTDAIALVRDRGRFMQEAVPNGKGGMAAIVGLNDEKILEICHEAAEGQILTPANYNSPGQIVLAGEYAAVERAITIAKSAGAKLAKLLPVSVPSHCAMMRAAADHLKDRLADVEINSPAIPVIHNADVKTFSEPAEIREALTRQLYSPVRWTQTIQLMHDKGIKYTFECGPGKVLAGLNKRIISDMVSEILGMPENFNRALELIKEIK